MYPSVVRRKIQRNEPVLVAAAVLNSPRVVELIAMMGFDCVWICNEHVSMDESELEHLVRAARAGKMDVMLRRRAGEYPELLRPLEIGVHGFLIPRVRNAAEARQVVEWTKFPPEGRRGLAGGNADAEYGFLPLTRYVERSNRETFIACQIEDPEAVEHVDDIASVPGVDILFVGPVDLSLGYGAPGELRHPSVLSALDRVAEACARHGKVAGTTCASVEDARSLMDSGYRLLAVGTDMRFVREGMWGLRRAYGELGFTFRDDMLPKD